MIWRQQLPVASPISLRAVGAATVSALIGSASHARTRALVLERWSAAEALLTDSGTSALVSALRLAVPPGGAVAFPGYACIDLAAAALRAGTRVRLYDLDPATLSPDLESVESVMRRGVDAIVVAHLFGYPADVAAVRALAVRDGVTIIEDAAQGAGATLHGRRLGSLGDLSILSFGRGKGLCAGGGGALLTFAEPWCSALRAVSVPASGRGITRMAKTAAQWALGRPSFYLLPARIPALQLGEMVYHKAGEPNAIARSSAKMLHSAIALEDADVSLRRANAMALEMRAVRQHDIRIVSAVPGGAPSYLRYALRDLSGTRSAEPALGVARPYPRTLAEQAELNPVRVSREPATPGASLLRESLFTMPTHRYVTHADVEALAAW